MEKSIMELVLKEVEDRPIATACAVLGLGLTILAHIRLSKVRKLNSLAHKMEDLTSQGKTIVFASGAVLEPHPHPAKFSREMRTIVATKPM